MDPTINALGRIATGLARPRAITIDLAPPPRRGRTLAGLAIAAALGAVATAIASRSCRDVDGAPDDGGTLSALDVTMR